VHETQLYVSIKNKFFVATAAGKFKAGRDFAQGKKRPFSIGYSVEFLSGENRDAKQTFSV